MSKSHRRPWTMSWVLLFLLATAMAGQSPTDTEAPEPVPMEIVEQSASVGPGELFVVRVDSAGLDITDITVAVEVYPAADAPLSSAALDDLRPLISSDDNTAAEVLVSANGFVTLRLPVGGETGGGELALTEPGVYPIRLRLLDGAGAVATADTTLLYRPSPGSDTTTKSVVGLAIDIGEGALSIEQATEMLAADVDLQPAIVVHRDAVAELERSEPARRAFLGALRSRVVIVGTTTPLDLAALNAVGQADAYWLARDQMHRRMSALGVPVDLSAMVIDAPLTVESASLLSQSGVLTAVAHRLVDPGVGEPWPVTSGFVDSGGQRLFVLGTDVGRLSASAAIADTPVAQAHGLAAALWTESSSGDSPTALLGELARLDDPAAALALLTDDSMRTLFDLRTITDPGFQQRRAESVVAPREVAAQDLSPLAPALTRIEDLLLRYDAFHIDGPRSSGHYREVVLEAFRVDVAPTTRNDTLGRVENELNEAFGHITLPGNQSVTLAAQSALLPVAVESSADGARSVRVRVTSDKITLADPELLLTVQPGMGTVDVPVRTRSLGASPLTVTLLTPDGAKVLATTRFQVRSTAVPGLGLLVSAVGLGGLLAWWYVSLRRSARAKAKAKGELDSSEAARNPIDLTADGDGAAPTAQGQVHVDDSV